MKTFLAFVVLFLFSSVECLHAQRIFYSEPDRDDFRQMNFDVIGKYGGNYLIYKNIRSRYLIAIYDAEMKLKEKADLNFIPDRAINTDVYYTPEHAIVVYQYQKKNIVYCMGVKIDGNGKQIGEPMQLDTTQIGIFSDNKIYSTIQSDDKQKLMIFKIKNRQKDDFTIQTLLLSSNLIPIRKATINYYLENNRESIADFYLDNDGNFLFSHVSRPGQREYISRAKLVMLPVYGDTVRKIDLKLDKVFLDELRIKVDNLNERYVLASLYSKAKKGNIDGLFAAIVNKDVTEISESTIEFNEDFRSQAKGDNSSKMAFNDYYLKHFIVRKDGGVIITGESAYSNNRGSNWNRWDNPWFWGNSWGPGSYWGWNSWNNFGSWGWGNQWGFNNFSGSQQTRFFADNVMVLSLNKEARIEWNSVVIKSQFDDNTDNLLSYQIMNSGSELLFLYNEWSRRNPMLNAQSVSPAGKVNKEAPLKSLDKGYEFMIRMGKQVSAREMIVPCVYRNAFSFARIEF